MLYAFASFLSMVPFRRGHSIVYINGQKQRLRSNATFSVQMLKDCLSNAMSVFEQYIQNIKVD